MVKRDLVTKSKPIEFSWEGLKKEQNLEVTGVPASDIVEDKAITLAATCNF